jgi:uncharacterized protein (UPF0147 family)
VCFLRVRRHTLVVGSGESSITQMCSCLHRIVTDHGVHRRLRALNTSSHGHCRAHSRVTKG